MLSLGPQGLPGHVQGLSNKALLIDPNGPLGGFPTGRRPPDTHFPSGAAHIVQGASAKFGVAGNRFPMFSQVVPISPPNPAGEAFEGLPEMQEPGLKFPVIKDK